ncbi:TetR/AcrR family transcriptional regulator [Solibacillus silvestris]|uniref:TetR/AcrR family transcriptional regulator n=1 Tax=Solibacillus silvestris TaxID=76853 RepID=UPI003F7EFA66
MLKKSDPRAVRTKEMIKDAVFELLKEGILLNQLTVQKITKQATLNRTTFYLHYEDINHLLNELVQEIFSEVTEKIKDLNVTHKLSKKNDLIELLNYLASQKHFLKLLFQFEQFEKVLFELMKNLIEMRRFNSMHVSSKSIVDSQIKSASIVGVITWWLKDGAHLSAQFIADQIHLMYRA